MSTFQWRPILRYLLLGLIIPFVFALEPLGYWRPFVVLLLGGLLHFSDRQHLLLFVFGLIMPLAFAPFGYWPLAILSLAGLFYFSGLSSAKPFLGGWLWGMGQFLFGVHWIYVSTHVFAKAPVPMAVILVVLLASYMALYPALLLWITQKLRKRGVSGLALALAFACAWTLLELLRGYLFKGFPWLSVGYSQMLSPLASVAPVVGVYGVGFVVALLASVGLTAALTKRRAHILIFTALLVLTIGGGFELNKVQWTQPMGQQEVRAMIVQGNISQDKKWEPEWLEPTVMRYYNMTVDNWDDVDMVVWPEVAIPGIYHEFDEVLFNPLAAKAKQINKTVLTGIMNIENNYIANSVVQLGDEPKFYYKQHLVPFAEYFPVPQFVKNWLQAIHLPFMDLYTGNGEQPLDINGNKIGASICFEDVFGEEMIKALPEAKLLVNVTNDGWFGESIAPHQHMQMAQMRSLETGRWMIRAANTGISAVIDHRGQVQASLPQFQTDVLKYPVPLYQGTTPYVRISNWPLCILAVMLLLIIGYSQRFNKSD